MIIVSHVLAQNITVLNNQLGSKTYPFYPEGTTDSFCGSKELGHETDCCIQCPSYNKTNVGSFTSIMA
jgi:hypothetical protein